MPPAPHEIEIKLEGEAAEAEAAATSLRERLGAPVAVRSLRSVYFDTPALALRDAALTLRIRDDGGGFTQTVKHGGEAAGGLFRRAEWEVEVADATHPDLHAARQTPVAAVLKRARGALRSAFETRVERHVWTLAREGAIVEVALDRGEVTAAGRTAPLFELELELKAGPAAALFAVLREVAGTGTWRLGTMAKSERGFALLANRSPRPAKAEPVRLDPGMTTAEAAGAVLHACLRHFRRNEPLVVAERDPEALHQARVALRRLRSALSLFGPVLRDDGFDRFKAALGQVSRQLGEARNLDVYLAHAAPPVDASGPEGAGAATFLAAMRARRAAAYEAVIATLAGAPFRNVMLDVLAWIEAGEWRLSDDPLRRASREEPIARYAAGVLDRERRRVKRKGRHLDRLDPHRRHRVRIAAKTLRYAAEFVESLATKRKARARYRAFVDAMAALQGDLGDLNDIQTGHDIAVHHAAAPPGHPGDVAAAFVAGQSTGHDEARTAGLLRAAVRHHRAVVAAKRFWRRWDATPT